jgi:bla regulator protein blaR1
MTSWFFIEMAAKSALICSIALLLAMALRGRAAADRATVLRVGAGLLVALPLIDLAFPVLQIEAFAAPALPAFSTSDMTVAEMEQLLALAATLPPVEPTLWDDPTPLFIVIWAAGALAVALRLVVGLTTLSRWTRSAEPVTDPYWLDALERARVASGASDRLQLMVADKVPGPLGWGWRNPVILIDYDTYAEREEADPILAHEVAHIARRDWPALMMTRLATALFWFNPLVWTLAREAVQQAEEAADAHAARTVEPTRYAETLLSWGQIGRGIAVPANSIAPGARALSRRVRAVLDARLVERSARSRIAVVAVLLCVGVAAPVAALELVEAARPEPAPAAPAAPAAPMAMAALAHPHPAAPHAPPAPPARPSRTAPDAPEAPEAPELPEVDIGPAMSELRRVPHEVARALERVNPEEIARAIRESGHAHVSSEQMREALAQVRARMPRAIPMPAPMPRIDVAELQARIRHSMPNQEELNRRVRVAMRASRSGLEAGARSMERGAERMQEQARRFRDSRERERIIAEAREEGKTVTHEQLIRAADELEQGARSMRDGARQMRESFREHHD